MVMTIRGRKMVIDLFLRGNHLTIYTNPLDNGNMCSPLSPKECPMSKREEEVPHET